MQIILNTDGGARGNPGPAGAGILIDIDGSKKEFGFYLGDNLTNNQAEYLALILGLRLLAQDKQMLSATSVTVKMDSELVIKQLNGQYAVKDPNMALLHKQVKTESAKFSMIQFTHIERAENKSADRLVNLILDAKDGIR